MLDPVILKKLWPRAPDALIADTAARADAVFAKYHLSSVLHVGHFMAQISHECGGGTIKEENLNYTSASRIAVVWPKRFTIESAEPYVRNPRALADKVYNGRMGNRLGSDDGWNYRGRGLLQLTGRESYQKIGAKLSIDLEGNPGLVNAYDKTMEVAVAEFVELGCLPLCTSWDEDALVAVTRRVNGGTTGLAERREWLKKWKSALVNQPSTPAKPAPQIPAPSTPAAPAPGKAHEPPPVTPSPLAAFLQLIASLFTRGK